MKANPDTTCAHCSRDMSVNPYQKCSHGGRCVSITEFNELLAPAAKEDGIPEEPVLCVICNKTWEDHFTLGRQKVCYNQDPSRMAIIQGTTFTAPPEAPVASLQEPEGDELKEFLSVCDGDCDHPYCWSQKSEDLPPLDYDREAMFKEGEAKKLKLSWIIDQANQRSLSCRERQLLTALYELRKLRSQESK